MVIDGSSNTAARNAVGEVLVNVSMYGVSGVSCALVTPATAMHVPASRRHKAHKTQCLPIALQSVRDGAQHREALRNQPIQPGPLYAEITLQM